MKKILAAPRRYIQGPGVIDEVGHVVQALGDKALVLWSNTPRQLVAESVRQSFSAASVQVEECLFAGEATQKQRRLIGEVAQRIGARAVVAFGGGKVLDVAKGVAFDAGAAMVSCPTIASTDAPTSAVSVWYDEQGNFQSFEMWPFNPDVVLVDTSVIVRAPVQTFVAGMGDALATWIEAEAVHKSRASNFLGGQATMAALHWARLSFDVLMEYGLDACRDATHHLLTPAVERVVEANVLLSGIGFESVGLACAHDVGNFLSNFKECREKGLMHGHKVGFGIATQLCLDDEVPPSRRRAIVDFEIALGLPVTLEELGLESISKAQLKEIGDHCASAGSLSSNHPFPVTSEAIVHAIGAADALGRERRDRFQRGR